MRPRVAEAWLAFLIERQPHKRIALRHLGQMLDRSYSGYAAQETAIRHLRTIATQYPDLWTVFQTQQRLLGNFKAEDFR